MAKTTRKPRKRTKSRWLYPRTTRPGGLKYEFGKMAENGSTRKHAKLETWKQ